MITGLLLRGPVQKLLDHLGQFAAHPFGFRAMNVVDVTGIRAVTAAFPLLIIPPNRLFRAGFGQVLDAIVKRFPR
jgi:hypothetical protein